MYLARTKDKRLFLNTDKGKRGKTGSIYTKKGNKSNDKYIKVGVISKCKILCTETLCCWRSDVSKRKDKLWRMYDQGSSKLEKELDIVNILANLRNFATYLKYQMKENEQIKSLIDNSGTNLLILDSSDENYQLQS